MELNFFVPKSPRRKAKVTVQKTGRLGFSSASNDLLGLELDMYAKFGENREGDLFLVITDTEGENTFKISKAGAYFYINAKSFLEDIKVDYEAPDTVIFDLSKTGTKNIYKMEKRVIKRNE